MKKLISIVTACYNEEENVQPLAAKVAEVMTQLPQYNYEHIFIDNASQDNTVPLLREVAARDKRVKVIVNARNFGHIRSPSYALLQAKGDAVISLVADFQDPPELIPEFVRCWEEGAKVVAAVKKQSKETWWVFYLRKAYYRILEKIAEAPVIKNFTGFGLYDKKIMDVIRAYGDPQPYFRGLLSDFGYDIERVEYVQPARTRGKSKNNFFTLLDMAILGTTSYSRVPLRLATLLGFTLSGMSLLVALGYLVYKFLFWYQVPFGITPLLVGGFVFFSVQLLFIGLLGEYIAAIHVRVLKKPLVIERERINFDEPSN